MSQDLNLTLNFKDEFDLVTLEKNNSIIAISFYHTCAGLNQNLALDRRQEKLCSAESWSHQSHHPQLWHILEFTAFLNTSDKSR